MKTRLIGLLALFFATTFGSPPIFAQNGIVLTELSGNDLTDPEDDGNADANVFSGGNSPFGERNIFAIDNDINTKWLSFSPDGTFFQFQLSNGASPLQGYTITSANDAPERDPYAWVLSGSTNGFNYTPIETRTAVDFVDRLETQLFSIEESPSYEFYQFSFQTAQGAGAPDPGSPNSIQIAEIELFADDRRPLEGDIDGDGDIDLSELFVAPGDTLATDGISDANLLRDALGNSVPANQGGDLDGDRVVTLLDFRILKENLDLFNASTGVPEPLSVSFALVSALALGVAGGRGRRVPLSLLLVCTAGALAPRQSEAADPIATIITTNETVTNFTQVLDYDLNSDADQPFNNAGIARSGTIFNDALKVNSNARSDQGRVMALIEPEQRGSTLSQGGAFLDQYTFAHWQYIDRFVDWGGTAQGNIKIPRSGWIDAAHRNGVKIYGNIFLAPTVFGGTAAQVDYLVQKQPDGSFPVADRLISIAETQGFDGYFLNQEVNGVGSATAEQVGQFMDYIQANSQVEVTWYDAQTEAGFVGWQDELNSQNDRFFQNNGNVVSDAMFLDFGASVTELQSSKTVANNLGRSEFDLYAGALLEAGGIAAGAGQLLNSFGGPLGTHRSSLGLFRPDNAPWEAATSDSSGFDIEAMIQADTETYVGASGDPSDTANNVPGTFWRGIANYVSAKSPLVDDTFVTNFNYGLGRKYAIEGTVSSRTDWNNIGLQDVLPTWRWVVDTTDPTPLEARFDFDEAYHGGNSIQVTGSLDADTDLPLYLASMPVHSDSKLQLAFKTGEVGDSSAELLVVFEGDEGNPVAFPLGSTTHDGWNHFSTDLGGFDGQKIASLGLRFKDNDDPDYQLNVGRLGVIRGAIDIPAAPTNATAQEVTIDGATADVRLLWDHSTDHSRNADNGIYNYNVLRREEDGRRTFLGGASTNAFFVDGLERGNGELITLLEIEAVGNEFGVSTAEQYKVRWETTGVITIDRQTGEVTLANALADTVEVASYTITSPGGVLNAGQWDSLADQSTPAWQEGTANGNTLSEGSGGSPLVLSSDSAVSLGNAFQPTEIAFGVDDENVQFEYLSDGETVQANVVFIGESSNNLTLTIDTATGEATLENTSTFDTAIDSYRILSDDGTLNPDGWQSLADQGESGWEESNPSENQLAELNFTDQLEIASGETFDLGTLFTPGAFQGLTFEFLTEGSDTLMQGIVRYDSLQGDFNQDGTIDAADYTVWRDGLGTTYDQSDYDDWASNYGATIASGTAAATSTPVPEPLTAALLAIAVAASPLIRCEQFPS